MPYFPEEWMNELLSKTDIVSIASDYTVLSPKGGRYWGCCPLHNEKTPSFSVQPEKQMFYCFGCHEGGGVINLVMKAERLSFSDAVSMLAQRAGMELPDEVNDKKLKAQREYRDKLSKITREAALFYHETLKSDAGKEARKYLESRNVKWDTAVRFGLGFAPDSWDALTGRLLGKGYSEKELTDAGVAVRNRNGHCYDAYRGRLIYPIIATNSRVLGFGARTLKKDEQPKYINTGDTPIYNKRNNLYGMNMQKGLKGDLLMVEGYMDVISLYAAGITNVVATLGTAMTQNQARLIKRYTEKVFLCYDGDSAGQNATLRGIDILSAEGLDTKVITVPGGLDPDDYVKKYGRDAFLKLKDTALTANGYKLANMAGRFDLGTENGREAYAKKACAFVAGLQPVEKERYIPFIARKIGLSVDIVREQCGIGAKESNAANTTGKLRNPVKRGGMDEVRPETDRIERTLVNCMLRGRDHAAYAANAMAMEDIRFESESLEEFSQLLLLAYADKEQPDTALIMADMQNPSGAAAVLADDPVTGDADRVADDCVKRLKKKRIEQEINELAVAEASVADEELRHELRTKLFEAQKRLIQYK